MKPLQKKLANLYQHLEGKAILVRNILKLDTPSKYFFGGNIAYSAGEVVKDRCLLDTSFLVWDGLFPPTTETKNVTAPSVLSSQRTL
jgi:hypothetical protein